MRLIILLDEKVNSNFIKEQDVIMTNNYKFYVENNNRDVILVDYSLEDENPELSEKVNEMFANLPKQYYKYRNVLFASLFRPITSICAQIEVIVKEKDICELVLVGGSEHLFFTTTAAEGEGRKWWYKSSWLFNGIIYRYFTGEKDLSILWLRKESNVKLALVNNIRETILLYKGLLSKIILSMTSKRDNNNQRLVNKGKKTVLAIVNLPLQLRHMKSLLSSIEIIDPMFIVPSNFKTEDNNNIIYTKPLGVMSLLKLFYTYTIKRDKNKYQIYFDLKGMNLHIPCGQFERSLKLISFLMMCNSIELKNAIINLKLPKTYLIATDMTFGRDILVCNGVAKELGVKHINFQYVAMKRMLYPQMDLADNYYLYSKRTYDLFKNYSCIYHYYLPIKRQPVIKNIKVSREVIITIFTQPDMYTDRYLHFIKMLLDRLNSEEELSVKILIKPHYRQDKINEFYDCIFGTSIAQIVGKDEDVEKLILKSDIIISMTSSVLFEALMLGKMGIIVDLDGLDRDAIYNNDICFPEVNFVVNSIEELITLIKEHTEYLVRYKKRYERFFNESGVTIDYDKIFLD